jgi:hypothetical protein
VSAKASDQAKTALAVAFDAAGEGRSAHSHIWKISEVGDKTSEGFACMKSCRLVSLYFYAFYSLSLSLSLSQSVSLSSVSHSNTQIEWERRGCEKPMLCDYMHVLRSNANSEMV